MISKYIGFFKLVCILVCIFGVFKINFVFYKIKKNSLNKSFYGWDYLFCVKGNALLKFKQNDMVLVHVLGRNGKILMTIEKIIGIPKDRVQEIYLDKCLWVKVMNKSGRVKTFKFGNDQVCSTNYPGINGPIIEYTLKDEYFVKPASGKQVDFKIISPRIKKSSIRGKILFHFSL